jgi:hypothetical protein
MATPFKKLLPGNPRDGMILTQCLAAFLILLSLLLSGCGSVSAKQGSAAQVLEVSPSTVSFASTPVGQTETTTVVLTNRSKSVLKIQSMQVNAPGEFSVQGSSSITLTPGESTRVVVLFKPTKKESYSAQLSIVGKATDPNQSSGVVIINDGFLTTVPLSGTVRSVQATPTIAVTPTNVQLNSGQSQQFTAVVSGVSNSGVTWNAALGSITSSGLYTAPNVQTLTNDTVSATSVTSSTLSASAQVEVTPPNSVKGLYIAPDGSDSGPGTQAQPWRTFGRAISALTPGATLVLEDGIYNASTTGVLNVNCGAGAPNGTASAPITVIAQNERQVTLQGEGYSGVQIENCSYWIVQGLYVTNTDVDMYPCSYHNISVANSDHISVIRNVVDHTNGYCNAHGIFVAYGNGYNLVQENEVYDFHRHGIGFGYNSNNTARRNYVNPRGRTDVGGCQDSACQYSGHFGYAAYPNALSVFENNISEGMQSIIPGDSGVGYDHEADYVQGDNHDNAWYGNISLNDEYAWRAAARCDKGEACNNLLQPINDVIMNLVAYQSAPDTEGSSNVLYPRSTYNTTFNHVTQLGYAQTQGGEGTVGLLADYQCVDSDGSSGPAGGGVYSVYANNSLFANNGQGINFPDTSGNCQGTSITYTVAADHDAFFNNGTATAGGNVTNQVNLSSNQLGSCILWVPSSASSLKGRASDGGDIGATVLYEYANGTLTNTPLWNANGQFAPAGVATPDGLNRISGQSLFDVGTRLNVNQNGCSFPSTYTPHP